MTTKTIEDGDNMKKLVNEDCMEFMKDIDDESVDLVLTDPPYGIDFQNNYTKEKYNKISGDDEISYYPFAKQAYKKLKEDRHSYWFTRFDVYPQHYNELERIGYDVKNVIIGERGTLGGGGDLQATYAQQSEWLIYASKGRRPIQQTRLVRNDEQRIGNKTARENTPLDEWKTRFPDVWFDEEYPKISYNSSNKEGFDHPTAKRVEFLKWIIKLSTKEGETVFDPFAGSGTTLVAAEETNRNWVGCELNEKYFNIAKNHIKNRCDKFDS
jgi:site-specific DNA-methyltransferase (adenine-specific)